MGFDMTEGTVAAWLKKEGETVKKGEAIAEIETDKTTIQIEAFQGGTLIAINVPAGGKVPVGSVIGLIGDAGEKVTTAPKAGAISSSAPAVQTSAPSQASASADATPVAKRMAEENGVDLSKVKGTGEGGRITKGDVESHMQNAKSSDGRIVASPYAKVVAEESGVNLQNVRGSGPEGRIVSEDVKAAAKAAPSVAAVAAPVAQPIVAASVNGTKKPFTKMRQTIAQRMTASKTQVPHYYVTNSVEMDAALAMRTQINESLKGEGIKVSVNDLVVRATALALRKFPNMNATFAGDGLDMRDAVHVGIAVAMDGGLIVVTLRDADKKSLKQIGAEVPVIAARVREGKAQAGDLGEQTFTTSNLGMYGTESVYPIINQPDAGILGIGAAVQTPVVRDGQIVIRSMMQLVLAGDHRVTDGAEGAQFIAEIKRLLENPWALVL